MNSSRKHRMHVGIPWLRLRLPAWLALAVAIGATRTEAQDSTALRVNIAVNAVVVRARAQLDAGDGAAARTLLDSLVEAVEPGSLDKGEALYWRAVLSEQAADAEKDWRTLLIEVPLSPRVADVSLRLAELERARGRPTQARTHTLRLLRDFADSPLRARALLLTTRSYFDENDAPHACGVLAALRSEMPANGTEVRLQADEMAAQCRNVPAIAFSATGTAVSTAATVPVTLPASAPPGGPPTAPPNTPPATSATTPPVSTTSNAGVPPATPPASGGGGGVQRDSAVGRTGARGASPPATTPTPPATTTTRDTARGRFSVQLAAYDLRSQADALVRRLVSTGVDARVDGEVKPFRVRVGHFATQSEAAAELAKLKAKGHTGFVAELSPP